MWGLSWGVLVLATLTTVLGSARVTRLIVADSYPPILWLKERWDTWTGKTERRQAWWVLLSCPWCAGPYVTAVCLLWGVLSHLHWTWWAVWGWLGLSYLASMIVYHDEGRGDDDH